MDDLQRIQRRLARTLRKAVADQESASACAAIRAAAQQAMRLGANSAIADANLDIAFTLAHPEAVQYLECNDQGKRLIEMVRVHVAELRANEPNHVRLARLIGRYYRTLGKAQANQVAKDVVKSASRAGAAIVMRDLMARAAYRGAMQYG